METMQDIVSQEWNEQLYAKKHIDSNIRKYITTDSKCMAFINSGVRQVQTLIAGDYYTSKNVRLAQLKDMDLEKIVIDTYVTIAQCQTHTLFSTVTAMIAFRLNFSDHSDSIKTIAEIVAVLCNTDAFDIEKTDKYASLTIISRLPLTTEILLSIERSKYLPPMVCKPLTITSNYTSGHLTYNDSVILGSGNHHDDSICLDVINIINSVAMTINTNFVSTVEEQPSKQLINPDQVDQWNNFKKDSYSMYIKMIEQGNNFFFTHKVDKRGRLYAQGYHISTQGAPFKKAMLELANKEIVQGEIYY